MRKLHTSLLVSALAITAVSAPALLGSQAVAANYAASIYSDGDVYMHNYVNSLMSYAKENGDRLVVNYANEDLAQEMNQLDLAVVRGAEALIVNPITTSSGAYAIELASSNGELPVIFINRKPSDELLKSYVNAYYVGSDPSESGRYQVDIINQYLQAHPEADRNADGEIGYLLLQGEKGVPDTVMRTLSLESGMEASPITFKQLAKVSADWKFTEASRVTSDFALRNNGLDNLELIVANNDDMALGALEYLQSQGYNTGNPDKFIPIVGIDGLDRAVKAVEEGTLIGTVKNDFDTQARIAFKIAALAAEGKSVDKTTLGAFLYNGNEVSVPYLKITK